MKILIFNWRDIRHPQGGGAEAYLHEQAKRWVRAGHGVRWITSSFPGAPARESLDGIDVIRKGGRFGIYLQAVVSYFRFGRDADVIIDAENGIPFFTPLFSRKPGVLLIYHVHRNVWFKELPLPAAWVGWFLEIVVMPVVYRWRRVVTISASSEREVRALMPANPLTVVHSGIGEQYVPGPKSKHPSIVFLGRLKRYKSVDVLLRAVARLDPAMEINVIGRGDDEARLKQVAAEVGLTRTCFHGFLPEPEKIRLTQRAWVAVNPSFVEGWSITNIEANACGTPVIGSDVEGIRDSIVNGETGLLFPYGDEEALAGIIRRVMDDELLRQRLAANGRVHAAEFSWDRSAGLFLKTLEAIR